MAAGADPRAGAERLQVPPVPIGAARLGCQAAGARLAAEGMSVTVITFSLIVIAIIIIISHTVFEASCMPHQQHVCAALREIIPFVYIFQLEIIF